MEFGGRQHATGHARGGFPPADPVNGKGRRFQGPAHLVGEYRARGRRHAAWKNAQCRHRFGRGQLPAERNARCHCKIGECVSNHIEAEKSKSGDQAFAALESKPKAASGNTETQNQNRLFKNSEAVVFASNLLAAAGITGYQMMDPAQNPMPNFDAAASLVMADDSKSCKGDFASGKKQSSPADTISVKRLFTACRTDDSSLEIHYTLLKTDSGHLIQIAHMKMGDATGDVADAAFLQAAVL